MCVEDLTEATCTRIEKKFESLAEGDLEHAADTVSALWGAVKRDGDLKAPQSTPSPVSWVCLSRMSAHSTWSGCSYRQSHSVGYCKGCTYQIYPYGSLLRQEVLGQIL